MKPLAAPIVAVLLILLGFGYLLARSEPVGAVQGKVHFVRTGKPLGQVTVTLVPEKEDDRRRWRTRTNAHGEFVFRPVPVGTYQLFTAAERHSSASKPLRVVEAKTSEATLALTPTVPTLELAYTQQRTFGTHETPTLALTGIGSIGDKIAVTLYRAPLEAILKDPKRTEALGRLGNRWGDDAGKLPAALTPLCKTALMESMEPIQRVDREGFFSMRLPLRGLQQKPGLYLARLTHEKQSVWAWVQCTDSALVTQYSPADQRLLAFVVDIESGKPRAGALVQQLRAGQELARARTDANGLASLPVANLSGSATLATIGEDATMVYTQEGLYDDSQSLVGHTITDRPLYRPGQTIHYKTILRRPAKESAYSYKLPAGEMAQVTVTDPSGLELLKETKKVTASGAVLGEFSVNTEGQTGYYELTVRLGAQSHTHSIELASYRKPEFSVSVTPKQSRILRNTPLEATISASYYFGAPVANAKVHWSLTRETDWSADYDNTGWPSLEENLAGDDYGSGSLVVDGEGMLDGTGRLSLSLPTEPESPEKTEEGTAPPLPAQTERYTLSAYVVDDAEREVEQSATVRVTTADLKIALTPEGYLARVGEPTRLFITARTHEGTPLPNTPVRLTVQRRTEKATLTVLEPQEATTGADGRAILTITLPRSGDLELVATARDSAGREARSQQTLWVTPQSETDTDRTELSGLTLATDKRSYAPGETARVVIGSADTGQTVLLTIEGEKLFKAIPVTIRQNVTTVSVPVLAEYGPNVSLGACYVHSKQLAQTETPLRVTLPQKTLQVALTSDKPEYQPGQPASFTVAVTDAAGKPVATELALSVADEAIYALKDDDPKALRATFYPHRTSRIRTRHSFEILYLAGDSKEGITVKVREKFVDTAYWNPALRTDATGKARVTFALPDNLTTWRAVAHVVSDQTAVGYARAKILVNRPFFVRLDMPRFVVESDQVRLTGLVHNNSGQPQTARLRLRAPGLSEPERTLSVAAGTVGEASWSWTVPEGLAETTELTLEARTDTGQSDGIKLPLTVRPLARESVTNYSFTPEGTLRLILPPEAVAERSFLTVRVAPSLQAQVAVATEYLKKYPYGCVEQTVSRFVPLIAAGVADKKLVAEGVARLAAMQKGEQGWGWWYKDGFDAWHTSYALWGLLSARDAGFPVPSALLERGAKPLWAFLEEKKAPTAETAFAFYAVSCLDAPRAQALAPALLHRFGPPSKKRAETLAWLVLASLRLGLDPAPYATVLEEKASGDAVFVHWGETGERTTTAIAVRALLAARPQSSLIARATTYLLSTATEGYFGNTRETAFVIATLCQLPEFSQTKVAPAITLTVNGKPASLALRGRLLELRLPATALRKGENLLRLSQGRATATLRQTTRTASLPALEAKGLKVRREYIRLASGPKGLLPEGVATSFPQGETVRVRLIVEATEPQEFVLLEDRFPAGFEPNARGTLEEEDSYGEWSFWYSHIDVRDDRIALFTRRLEKGKHVYEYHLRAQTAGKAHALPAALTPMYSANLRAESQGDILEIH